MPIVMRRHSVDGQAVVAAADVSCLGKKHTGGKRVLDLEKFRSFYEGEETSEGKLAAALKTCDSANLVGVLSVAAAIGAKLASKGDILVIGGVPHLQIYRVPKG